MHFTSIRNLSDTIDYYWLVPYLLRFIAGCVFTCILKIYEEMNQELNPTLNK
jgi:hypothetical protein